MAGELDSIESGNNSSVNRPSTSQQQSVPIWRQCADWLVRVGILERGHRVTWQTATASDLANILRDGVLLCQLAYTLSEPSIDMREVALRPQLSQFLCLKNICLFLGACSQHFGFHSDDLFDAWQLYKLSDFAKVLQALSKLSHWNGAKLKVKGFPDLPPSISKTHEYYNQEIYQKLAEAVDEQEPEEEEYSRLGQQDHTGEIYDQIIYRRLSSHEKDEELIPKDRREHCIKELLDTERSYLHALNDLSVQFVTPLRLMLDHTDQRILFLNLPELIQIHTAFHSELAKQSRLSWSSPNTETGLGQLFCKWKLQFCAYSDYCTHLPPAQRRLEQLCNESATVKLKVAECERNANQGRFRLQDLLSVPMQRVLKYHLLLKELLKHCQENTAEYLSNQEALDAMLDLALYVNEAKRDQECLQTLGEIERSIRDLQMPENTHLHDYGRLLKDGEVKLMSHQDKSKKYKARHIFLFDRVLLICKALKKGNAYTYKAGLILQDYQCEEYPEQSGAASLVKSGFQWSLVHNKAEDVVVMQAKQRDTRDKWVNAIKLAHDNVFPQDRLDTDHFFQMHSFPRGSQCLQCRKLLRGVFYQGYKCQNCPSQVHKECIANLWGCGQTMIAQRPASFPHNNSTLPMKQIFRATKDFFGGNQAGPDFLCFREGDLVELLSTVTELNGYWRGKQPNGHVGLFPSDHVRRSRLSQNIGRHATWHAIDFSAQSPVAPIVFDTELSQPSDPQELEIMLQTYNWFQGRISREVAEQKLSALPNGTFLVRYSDKQRQLVISIAFNHDVKHVKIERLDSRFYLDTSRYFSTVPEIIDYYSRVSLRESFQALDTTLQKAFPESFVGYAIALHSFAGTETNMLSLQKGDTIMILSKTGGERGWWKGKLGSQIGYFPLAYVRQTANSLGERHQSANNLIHLPIQHTNSVNCLLTGDRDAAGFNAAMHSTDIIVNGICDMGVEEELVK